MNHRRQSTAGTAGGGVGVVVILGDSLYYIGLHLEALYHLLL